MNSKQILSAMLLIIATAFFFIGLHNLDNAWNMRTVEDLYGGNWCDYDVLSINCYTPFQSYPISIVIMFGSFWLVVFTCLVNIHEKH